MTGHGDFRVVLFREDREEKIEKRKMELVHPGKGACCASSVSCLKRWRQNCHEFKTNLGYVVSLRAAQAAE